MKPIEEYIEDKHDEPAEIYITKTLRRIMKLPGRNEQCPCGSGKKFKKCCINSEVFGYFGV